MPALKQSISMSSLSSVDKTDVSLSYITQCTKKASSVSHLLKEHGHNSAVQLRNMHVAELHKRDMALNLNHKKKKKRKHGVTANLSGTRYEVVRQMAEKIGFTITKEEDTTSYVMWNDSFISMDKISDLKPYQKINHFPGMGEVTRKDSLARNFMKIQKSLPEDFGFVPKTWILPAEHNHLQNYAKELKARKKMKTFIIKPSNGAQGHGIMLSRNAEKIPPAEHFIVQEYIDKPLLLDGYKFDLRVYVLITSTDPLRVFLFNDGLVRLSTEKYLPPHESNLNRLFMHLTNYSVNRHSENYEKSSSVDSGSKRSIRYFNDFLRKNDIDVARLWRKISDMIVKTILVAQPHVLHSYRMCRPGSMHGADSVCFEILGFDILIDGKLNPWLLEINRSPSFNTDERIDYDIKSSLIEDTFRLLNIKQSDKRRNMAAQKAEAQKRLFRMGKKVDLDITEMEKRKVSIERRKEELKELLSRIKKATIKEEFENKNCGHFRRIFPCEDKTRQEKYCTLLATSFSVFLCGRGTAMQKEIQITYNNKYREDDIMDMLAECEADERDGKLFTGAGTRPRIPKPLLSMPECGMTAEEQEDLEEDEGSESGSPNLSPASGRRIMLTPTSHSRSLSSIRRLDGPQSQKSADSQHFDGRIGHRPDTSISLNDEIDLDQRDKQSGLTSNNNAMVLQKVSIEENFLSSMVKEREEELIKKTLYALNEMRIKFPGKTDLEADYLLDKLNDNWKFHKPRIASYWLVKLDSIKRRKVTDIVRSNVKAVLQRIWRCAEAEDLRLYRIFSRVFNRLLWSHGQGLWNCFSSSGNSWETIFSKSSEIITGCELNCCRRIVQLCRDCLLIVYQFAAEAKGMVQLQAVESDETVSSQNGYSTKLRSGNSRDGKISQWSPQTFSQRYTKLYQPRAEGIGT